MLHTNKPLYRTLARERLREMSQTPAAQAIPADKAGTWETAPAAGNSANGITARDAFARRPRLARNRGRRDA
ncbi:hypothetical protein E4J93_01940 [Collinsella sp. BA40]|uniref:hypothetical protein n=1 Tax=Collinsella sp. BA40 TaxID=2560852 RepID=UPI0011C76A78|nr:hypothetical protein [Collinsella sp. BA40]TXF38646.1 hypothetical protein E4J93_01940 [Collinsella sp. BA40]